MDEETKRKLIYELKRRIRIFEEERDVCKDHLEKIDARIYTLYILIDNFIYNNESSEDVKDYEEELTELIKIKNINEDKICNYETLLTDTYLELENVGIIFD